MNLIAAAAVMAAMLTGPLPSTVGSPHGLSAPLETQHQHVAQATQNVRPVPSTPDGGQRIAAFWIILPD